MGSWCYRRSYHSQQSQLIVVSLPGAKEPSMKQILFAALLFFSITACEIREEYTFKEDGSGVYEMAFDLTDLMSMNQETDSSATQQSVDTVIHFAAMLEEKKDSISQLSTEEQQKLEALRPLQFSMKVDDSTQQMFMKLRYDFEKLEDLEKFSEAVEQANIKELKEISGSDSESSDENVSDSTQQEKPDIFTMAESFNTYFGRDKFSRKITEEARLKAVQQKDTALTADDPFADMIAFKQVFRFPYRVKAVDNERAKILSDFKGIELEANMYDLNSNPDVFNIEVEFEQ